MKCHCRVRHCLWWLVPLIDFFAMVTKNSPGKSPIPWDSNTKDCPSRWYMCPLHSEPEKPLSCVWIDHLRQQTQRPRPRWSGHSVSHLCHINLYLCHPMGHCCLSVTGGADVGYCPLHCHRWPWYGVHVSQYLFGWCGWSVRVWGVVEPILSGGSMVLNNNLLLFSWNFTLT